MKNERLEILVNKYIDNELTDSDRKELDILLTDKANKDYFESITSLFNKVDNLEHSHKEINITSTVTSQIKNNMENSLLQKISSWFSESFNGQKVGYGITFALGAVLVGIITLFEMEQSNINDEFLTGTFADRNYDETFFIDRHPLNGSVKLQYSEGVVILDISVKAETLVNCELKYDQNALAFYGVKNIEPGTESKFSSSKNVVYLSNIESDHYMVFLRVLKKTESNVSAKFYDGITEIENISIKVNN